jgi:hypothetical protein
MPSVLLFWTIFNPLGMSPTGLEKMNVGCDLFKSYDCNRDEC